MSRGVVLDSITFVIDDKSITVTHANARLLYRELRNMFEPKRSIRRENPQQKPVSDDTAGSIGVGWTESVVVPYRRTKNAR